jgi:hypothetical protein
MRSAEDRGVAASDPIIRVSIIPERMHLIADPLGLAPYLLPWPKIPAAFRSIQHSTEMASEETPDNSRAGRTRLRIRTNGRSLAGQLLSTARLIVKLPPQTSSRTSSTEHARTANGCRATERA